MSAPSGPRVVLSALVPLVAALVALSCVAAPLPPRGARVAVVAGRPLEFAFTLSRRRLRTGWVTFVVKNEGRLAHDFAIEGRSTRLIRPHGSARLVVRFRIPGVYNFRCLLPGHASAGMSGTLTVSGPALPVLARAAGGERG